MNSSHVDAVVSARARFVQTLEYLKEKGISLLPVSSIMFWESGAVVAREDVKVFVTFRLVSPSGPNVTVIVTMDEGQLGNTTFFVPVEVRFISNSDHKNPLVIFNWSTHRWYLMGKVLAKDFLDIFGGQNTVEEE